MLRDFRTNPANTSSENKTTSGQGALKSFSKRRLGLSSSGNTEVAPQPVHTPPLNGTNPTLDRDAKNLRIQICKSAELCHARGRGGVCVQKMLRAFEAHSSLALKDLSKEPSSMAVLVPQGCQILTKSWFQTLD